MNIERLDARVELSGEAQRQEAAAPAAGLSQLLHQLDPMELRRLLRPLVLEIVHDELQAQLRHRGL